MAQPVLTQRESVAAAPCAGVAKIALIWGSVTCGGLLLAAALALWIHYGTTVFFETIASGIAGCF